MHEVLHLEDTAVESLQPGRSGKAEGVPGLEIEVRYNPGLATITARRSRHAELAEAISQHYAVESLIRAGIAQGPAIRLVASGPDHWLAISERLQGNRLYLDLVDKIGQLAAVTDQSDGRVVLRLRGQSVREVLSKCVPIDLHPRAFRSGSAVATVTGHIGVHLWQIADAPIYELVVLRSFARSLCEWFIDAAASVGCEFRP